MKGAAAIVYRSRLIASVLAFGPERV